jgi:hypothetical protein
MAIEPPSSSIETKPDLAIDNITNGTFSLENILGENHEFIEHPGSKGWDEETPEGTVAEGFCVECEGYILHSN